MLLLTKTLQYIKVNPLLQKLTKLPVATPEYWPSVLIFCKKVFCKSTSHIPTNIPHPKWHIPNIPRPKHSEYPTSHTFYIPNIHFSNISHLKHITSTACHIPNILHSKDPISPTFRNPKFSRPENSYPKLPLSLTSHISNILYSQHQTSPTSQILKHPHLKHCTKFPHLSILHLEYLTS